MLLERYPRVFNQKLGTMGDFEAALRLSKDAKPVFCKARSVPFALKEVVGSELDRLEKEGILVKVSSSEWATPIVPVPKGDGRIRLCGDYKVTINSSLEVDQYPLPKPDDLFASLAGGKRFTKLDLTQAYQQMPLELESQKLVTINTHQGLYRYTRLPFGVAPAPAIFQRTMDTILQGLPHVLCFIDDILFTGSNEEEHLQNLESVLKRLDHHGLMVKKSKCAFMQESVDYLKHRVNEEGLHTSTEKLEAIQQAPVPHNQQQLRSFLGLIQYYGRFIPDLASIMAGERWGRCYLSPTLTFLIACVRP